MRVRHNGCITTGQRERNAASAQKKRKENRQEKPRRSRQKVFLAPMHVQQTRLEEKKGKQ
jgi:hypothetical protein